MLPKPGPKAHPHPPLGGCPCPFYRRYPTKPALRACRGRLVHNRGRVWTTCSGTQEQSPRPDLCAELRRLPRVKAAQSPARSPRSSHLRTRPPAQQAPSPECPYAVPATAPRHHRVAGPRPAQPSGPPEFARLLRRAAEQSQVAARANRDAQQSRDLLSVVPLGGIPDAAANATARTSANTAEPTSSGFDGSTKNPTTTNPVNATERANSAAGTARRRNHARRQGTKTSTSVAARPRGRPISAVESHGCTSAAKAKSANHRQRGR